MRTAMSKWKRLKPITDVLGGHPNFPLPLKLPMNCRIGTGFLFGVGGAKITKDGKIIWQETRQTKWNDCLTVRDAERMALKEPDHDWRITIQKPLLLNRTYQRQGKGRWMLVRKGRGFA